MMAGPPARPACQICGEKPEDSVVVWPTRTFWNARGEVTLVICPRCNQLDAQSIALIYVDRIRSGHNLGYH